MIPIDFPESNTKFHAPSDMDESQVVTVPGYFGKIEGGSCDGHEIAVVAWKPTTEELKELNEGGAVYLTCFGGLPPHCIGTSFYAVTHTA